MTEDIKQSVMIGWTTMPTKKQASDLVNSIMSKKLTSCAQLEGPIQSSYMWKDKMITENEWRVCLKFPAIKAKELSEMITHVHPYDTPQWVYTEVVSTRDYADWIRKVIA
jgi:periplasmic divalent cation tolerance protein